MLVNFVILLILAWQWHTSYARAETSSLSASLHRHDRSEHKPEAIFPRSRSLWPNSSCSSYSSYYKCSRWSHCTDAGTCECFHNDNFIFECDNHGNRVSILDCYCLTFDEEKNTTEVGWCLYNCQHSRRVNAMGTHSVYYPLAQNMSELNDAMCSFFRRTGTLCGKCKNGSFLRAYSYDISCMSCHTSWLDYFKYLAIAYLPLTLFSLVIYLFEINISCSRLQGFVFFSQTIGSALMGRQIFIYLKKGSSSYQLYFLKILLSFYTIWNLDFFKSFNLDICLQLHVLSILSLDIFVAFYPFLLMAIICIVMRMHDQGSRLVLVLLRPFKLLFQLYKKNWKVKGSTVDAFSTFMFLTEAKLLGTCADILSPVQICDTAGIEGCRWAVFNNANLPYLGTEHIPYATLAMLILVMFVLLPTMLLILYPLPRFQKVISLLPRRIQIAMHVFLDSYQKCYKNGVGAGNRDCRWFSAVLISVRFLLFVLYITIQLFPMQELFAMILVLTAILTILVEPFKREFQYLATDLVVSVLLIAFLLVLLGVPMEPVQYTIVGVAVVLLHLAFISSLIFKWIVQQKKLKNQNDLQIVAIVE